MHMPAKLIDKYCICGSEERGDRVWGPPFAEKAWMALFSVTRKITEAPKAANSDRCLETTNSGEE